MNLGLQAKFSHTLRCKALRQVKKKQIKVKFWIRGPITSHPTERTVQYEDMVKHSPSSFNLSFHVNIS